MSSEGLRLRLATALVDGRLAAGEAANLLAATGASTVALVDELVACARELADAPVSSFRVGAVAVGRSGDLHLGMNLEFAGASLGATVHAEQAAISHALAGGERGIVEVAASAPPCGHCRQFMFELADPHLAVRCVGEAPRSLASLLPSAFGPHSLGHGASVFASRHGEVAGVHDHAPTTEAAARQAARTSHAPYGGCRSGVALRLRDGRVFVGRAIECAAFNPSLPALQAALVELHLAGAVAGEVVAAVFAGEPGRIDDFAGASLLWSRLSTVPLQRAAP